MQLHTFKARSIAEALRIVREELGPDASVLHTREIGSPLLAWVGGRLIEVTASAELTAPSRLPESWLCTRRVPAAELQDYRGTIRQNLLAAQRTEFSLVEQLAADRHD